MAAPDGQGCEVGHVDYQEAAQGFHIHRRVSFGLDALSEEEKRTIRDVLSDRDHFVASTANPGKVRKVSRSEPVYASASCQT